MGGYSNRLRPNAPPVMSPHARQALLLTQARPVLLSLLTLLGAPGCQFDHTGTRPPGASAPAPSDSAAGGTLSTFPSLGLDCERAGNCRCGAETRCSDDCSGASCAYQCDAGSRCAVRCSAGDCSLSCGDSARCLLQCDAGNCPLSCALGAECELFCDGGQCQVDCAATASCTVHCQGGSCNCTGDGSCIIP